MSPGIGRCSACRGQVLERGAGRAGRRGLGTSDALAAPYLAGAAAAAGAAGSLNLPPAKLVR